MQGHETYSRNSRIGLVTGHREELDTKRQERSAPIKTFIKMLLLKLQK